MVWVKAYKMFINGEWVDSSNKQRFNTVNPFNQETWATIPEATEEDVEKAIQAANITFEKSWKRTNGITRANLMFKLADLIDENAQKLAELESKDNGKLIRETKNQMHFAARNYRFFAGYADKIYGEVIPLDNVNIFDYTLRQPIGVVAMITAWNSPINLLTNKLAPALAAGNTVVVKPSEYASATTLEFASLMKKAGFPEGVFNVVTGNYKVGEYLTTNPNVAKISFTGGPHTGRIISKNASENLTPLTMELGGKSPNIIFDDAIIENAVLGAISGIFAASGQTCIAGSRLIVHNNVYDQVVEKLSDRIGTIKLGNPLEDATEMGPVANDLQYKRISSLIDEVESEGADVIQGGEPAATGILDKGYFIKPTIVANVKNSMKIAQEEVFGPVLSVIPFEEDAEAIQIANDSKYGLASGLWTTDLSRAHQVAKEIDAGQVWVNTYRTTAAQAPFGGMKQSGYGKERGFHALMEYTVVKNVMIDLSQDTRDPFSVRT